MLSALTLHAADRHDRVEEDTSSESEGLNEEACSCASSDLPTYMLPHGLKHPQATAQSQLSQADASVPYFSADGSYTSVSLQASQDMDAVAEANCSEKCSCCQAGGADQDFSMRSTQTAPSLDSDSNRGLRSRSRSAGALPSAPTGRRPPKLLHQSLVMPPLNVVMRRPIIDRVARYRSVPCPY